jgi:hypothetical protein
LFSRFKEAMTMRIASMTLMVAAVALAGCNPSKTRAPVTTTDKSGSTTTPSGEVAAKRGQSMVRFVNALPGAPNVAMNSGDSALFANVKYKTVTEYRPVGDNTADFRLLTSAIKAGEKPAAENHEALSDGGRYTVVAYPEKDGSGANLKVVRDELVPDAGKARVRIFNVASGVGEVDVVLAGQKDPLFDDVNYSMEAGFKDIDPVSGNVEVQAADTHRRLVSLKNMKFEAGKSYTIVVSGSPVSKVEAITFNDAVTPGAPVNN